MAKKKTEDDTTDPSAEKGADAKLKLFVGALVLLVGGAVLGGKVLAGGGETSATASEPTTTTTEPPGMVTSLDTITLNLADGRFLKVGMGFEVHDGEDYPRADMIDPTTKGFARELDASITILSSFTYEQLVGPDGKATAKAKLLEQARQLSGGAIKDVLFHEFVMQ